MRNSVLFLVLLLSACASDRQAGGVIGNTTGAVLEHRKSDAEPQPVVRQRPAPVEAQQPTRSDQVNLPPKKREHNIEED